MRKKGFGFMRLPKLKSVHEFGHLALRSSTLLLRFALTFYIVKILGYEASGIYGLAVGAVGIVPAAVGWGLNYFAARDIMGMDRDDALAIVRTRLTVTILSLSACSLVALGASLLSGLERNHLVVLIGVLVWLETLALDMHMPLLAMEKGREANLLVFVRSAFWVPFLIGGSFALPLLQSLTSVFMFWIAGHVLSGLLLLFFLRRVAWRATASAPLRRAWLASRLRRSWGIYLSDLSMVGTLYADRYMVSLLLGITVTGLYTFYWSLANALQTLVTTAVVQVLFPKIYKSFDPQRIDLFTSVMRRETTRVVAICLAGAALLLVAGEAAMRSLPMHFEISDGRWVFVLLTLSAVVRTASELLNTGLATLGKDGHYAVINMAGVVLSLLLSYALISLFGFLGVGLAALFTSLLLTGARLLFLTQFIYEFTEKAAPRELSRS